jgi:alkaline phosphatase
MMLIELRTLVENKSSQWLDLIAFLPCIVSRLGDDAFENTDYSRAYRPRSGRRYLTTEVIRLRGLWMVFSTKVEAAIRFPFLFLLCSVATASMAQQHTSSSIFAHNDYVQPILLQTAYEHEVGFIEADVFLRGNNLLVAHTRLEINKEKTLDRLYLEPLNKLVSKNNGYIYPHQEKKLTLMIDLKTEGVATLNALATILKKYPQLLSCKTFQVAVSGNVPDPVLWKNYPNFIHFDGRPSVPYTQDQLERVSLISDSFKNYSHWNGKGDLESVDLEKITKAIQQVHAKGKQIRFWAIPDFTDAWMKLMELRVDVLNTDHVTELSSFLKSKK